MEVLTPTEEQYNQLNGYKFGNAELQFVKDNNDKWVVGIEILNDTNFSEILNELLQLQRIEYTPFVDNINDI